ncbi:MAG: hypothetical protein Q8927_19425 [Bacteroidota bacterium]|nr:hypothetical protein [Bacteroidota bacterium]MDP4218375.1 hypothetical protein [Bacteroidota bacterium]MDP4247862.1 hypothetical protein [Bacteroidota bacterium]MDP4254821.1 hypothetical protein [Bacteroidota bacterium]MDP4258356.1 hypothetical protein [Bacteroidota bacterium]
MLPYFTAIIIAISFLASLVAWSKPRAEPYLRSFTIFLFLTLAVESMGLFFIMENKTNTILYNIFSVIEFSFYFYVLHEIIHHKNAKKLIGQVMWIYIVLVILNNLFIQKITSFPSITYSIGCLLVISFCIYYFLELFQLSRAVNLIRQPAFWVCSGLLFFYACSFPIFGLLNFLKNMPRATAQNFLIIIAFLNIFLYSSFTIAFLCRLKTRKSTS